MLQNGNIPKSALDHVYNSDVINYRIVCTKLRNSSTDHVPVKIEYTTCQTKTKMYSHKIQKRCLKNFTSEGWRNCLANMDWTEIDDSNNLDDMVKIFTKNVTTALDEVAPVKIITTKSNYKFGLSETTRNLIKDRDCTRQKIKKACNSEKIVLLSKYKSLRNKVNCLI